MRPYNQSHGQKRIVSVIVVLLILISTHSCQSLSSTSRQKRRQRGLVQTGRIDNSIKDGKAIDSITTSVIDDETERWWGMAGQTSRRKRQRGRKSTQELREDTVAISLSTPFVPRKNKPINNADLTVMTVREIDSVHLILPSTNNNTLDDVHPTDILADVTFVNGTSIRVNPRQLHQRRDNAIWMALRKAMNVTASELSAIAGNSVFTTREKLRNVKAGVEESTFVGNQKACEWGLKMEPKAMRQYCQVTGNIVHETGLHIRRIPGDGNTQEILVGASPDGLVVDSNNGSNGLLEIKSLWGRRNKKELPQFNHCPQRFWDQIQGQLAICDLDWCDLIMYIPPNSPRGPQKNYCILRIERDHAYWKETLLPAIQSFCVEVDELRVKCSNNNITDIGSNELQDDGNTI